jgi:hypothetical protein
LTENQEVRPTGTALYGAPILYYGLVGWPLTQWPDERGIIASRVLSALVSAILWAIAILPWARERRHWPARLAIVLTATPAALYFAGTIQPSGMEISAFAALWSLSMVVFGHLRRDSYATLSSWVQIAWPVLAISAVFVRFASAWFVAIVLLVSWVWSGVPVGRLLRDRRLMAAAALVAGAAALRLATFLSDRSSGIFGRGLDTPPEVNVVGLVADLLARLTRDPERAIGLMGWFDTQVPSLGTMPWFLMAGGITFLAVPFLRRRDLVALGTLLAVLGATVLVLEIAVTTTNGYEFWQPRYGFPIWMGVPILLAATLAAGQATTGSAVAPVLRWGCALSLGIMHLVSVAYLMARYMYGIVGFGSLGTLGWTPYIQTTLVVVLAVLGSAGLALAVVPTAIEEVPEDPRPQGQSLLSTAG